MNKRHGLTLVELLVVITIIAVLLALLMPALDKAIYQAELAVCGAHLKGIATGVQQYTVSNARHYPQRTAIQIGQYRRPDLLVWGNYGRVWGVPADDRLPLVPYLSLDMLLDPLNGLGVIDLGAESNLMKTKIYGNYGMWWSWRYEAASGGKGSYRLGQPFEWDGDRFDVLVSDMDLVQAGSGYAWAGHQDASQGLAHEVLRDTVVGTWSVQGESFPDREFESGASFTLSRWVGGLPRDRVDLNCGFADGSVTRLDTVRWDDWTSTGRTMRVPDATDSATTAPLYIQVPSR